MSYGSYLVVTCLGITPCYAILELLFGIPECFSMSILFSFRSHHSKLSKLTLGESEVSVWPLESVLTARCLRGLDGLSIRESVCNVRGCELARRMDHRLLKGWQKLLDKSMLKHRSQMQWKSVKRLVSILRVDRLRNPYLSIMSWSASSALVFLDSLNDPGRTNLSSDKEFLLLDSVMMFSLIGARTEWCLGLLLWRLQLCLLFSSSSVFVFVLMSKGDLRWPSSCSLKHMNIGYDSYFCLARTKTKYSPLHFYVGDCEAHDAHDDPDGDHAQDTDALPPAPWQTWLLAPGTSAHLTLCDASKKVVIVLWTIFVFIWRPI